jgi:hypothetical protein
MHSYSNEFFEHLCNQPTVVTDTELAVTIVII